MTDVQRKPPALSSGAGSCAPHRWARLCLPQSFRMLTPNQEGLSPALNLQAPVSSFLSGCLPQGEAARPVGFGPLQVSFGSKQAPLISLSRGALGMDILVQHPSWEMACFLYNSSGCLEKGAVVQLSSLSQKLHINKLS